MNINEKTLSVVNFNNRMQTLSANFDDAWKIEAIDKENHVIYKANPVVPKSNLDEKFLNKHRNRRNAKEIALKIFEQTIKADIASTLQDRIKEIESDLNGIIEIYAVNFFQRNQEADTKDGVEKRKKDFIQDINSKLVRISSALKPRKSVVDALAQQLNGDEALGRALVTQPAIIVSKAQEAPQKAPRAAALLSEAEAKRQGANAGINGAGVNGVAFEPPVVNVTEQQSLEAGPTGTLKVPLVMGQTLILRGEYNEIPEVRGHRRMSSWTPSQSSGKSSGSLPRSNSSLSLSLSPKELPGLRTVAKTRKSSFEIPQTLLTPQGLKKRLSTKLDIPSQIDEKLERLKKVIQKIENKNTLGVVTLKPYEKYAVKNLFSGLEEIIDLKEELAECERLRKVMFDTMKPDSSDGSSDTGSESSGSGSGPGLCINRTSGVKAVDVELSKKMNEIKRHLEGLDLINQEMQKSNLLSERIAKYEKQLVSISEISNASDKYQAFGDFRFDIIKQRADLNKQLLESRAIFEALEKEGNFNALLNDIKSVHEAIERRLEKIEYYIEKAFLSEETFKSLEGIKNNIDLLLSEIEKCKIKKTQISRIKEENVRVPSEMALKAAISNLKGKIDECIAAKDKLIIVLQSGKNKNEKIIKDVNKKIEDLLKAFSLI